MRWASRKSGNSNGEGPSRWSGIAEKSIRADEEEEEVYAIESLAAKKKEEKELKGEKVGT